MLQTKVGYRSNQSAQERDDRNEREIIRISLTHEARARHSTNNRASLNRVAFSYDVSIDYTNGLCCANGKVKLIPLDPPPEQLYSLVSGIGTDSIHFLTNIQQYNNCFQMTSFGATNVVPENYLMLSDNYKIVIRADKTPAGQHARRFNAPTIDEVAIFVVGENFESRDIVLNFRNDRLQSSETYKKVSSMNYYSYRLMIRENEDNHILKCRRLYHKYVVDMYVKIETERLTFIRFNQTKLRSEEYIHLREAINTDCLRHQYSLY
ncbi:uncharacterized protein LOC111030043 [Myzus persicae]|uniref:uncharacterized protein LOC111030043 n=1 Tax=Myzus persicae TaxID=13164 RepID=UPI000B93385D|nr:uncharacterized protein LOC111030043 [Myzus persicae]